MISHKPCTILPLKAHECVSYGISRSNVENTISNEKKDFKNASQIILPGVGSFPKHGVTVSAEALSPWNQVEERYKNIRGLLDGRRLGCQAKVMGDVVVDVPPESQVHKQVIRKSATLRDMNMDPATKLFYVEVEEPDMH